MTGSRTSLGLLANGLDKAWHDIQAIGVTDGLELTSKPPVKPLTRIGNLVMAVKCLGLHLNKVNNRHVITRKPLTQAAISKLAESAEPTPEFGMEIDKTAKLHV